MKIFLDDFNVYSDMHTRMAKHILCFLKCRKFGISLNPKNVHLWYFKG